MGVFDEGCMGMFNAIIPDELLHPTGVFKERLSQSSLYATMQRVNDAEARAVYDWLLSEGMKFHFGNERRPSSPMSRSSTSAKCTSPPCASPTTSAATPSASSISRA